MAMTEPHATGVRADDLQPLLDGRYGSRLTAPGFLVAYGGQGDPGANIAAFETNAFGIPDEVLRAPIALR